MRKRLYNALNYLVRRIKEHMSSILISVAMMLIPLAFASLLWATEHPDNSQIYYIVAIISTICAFTSWGKALDIAKQEHADDKKERKHLVDVIDAIATKIGVDVTKLQ
jgi:hypothetical protein